MSVENTGTKQQVIRELSVYSLSPYAKHESRVTNCKAHSATVFFFFTNTERNSMNDVAYYNEGVSLGESAAHSNYKSDTTSTSGNQQRGGESAHREVNANSPNGNEAEYEEIEEEVAGYLQPVPTDHGHSNTTPAVVYENQPNVTNQYEQIRK